MISEQHKRKRNETLNDGGLLKKEKMNLKFRRRQLELNKRDFEITKKERNHTSNGTVTFWGPQERNKHKHQNLRRQLQLNRQELELDKEEALIELKLQQKRNQDEKKAKALQNKAALQNKVNRMHAAHIKKHASRKKTGWVKETTEFEDLYKKSSLFKTPGREALAILTNLKTNNPYRTDSEIVEYGKKLASDPKIQFMNSHTRGFLMDPEFMAEKFKHRDSAFESNNHTRAYMTKHLYNHNTYYGPYGQKVATVMMEQAKQQTSRVV